MTELPIGWSNAPLADLAEIISGQSPESTTYNRDGVGLPFFQGKAEFGAMHPIPVKFCSAPLRIAEQDSVLLSVRAPVGPTNIAAQRCCIGRGLASIRPLGGISTRFILYFFRAIETQLATLGTGSTFDAISRNTLTSLECRVPPLPEQRRIVAKIEELFSELDNAVASLTAARDQLKAYRQALLKYAFEGKLTTDWRVTHRGKLELPEELIVHSDSLPEGWGYARAEDIMGFITKGTTPSKELLFADVGEIPFIKVYNLTRGGYVDFSIEPTFIRETTHNGALKRSRVFPGDVLMNIVGPPLGKVSIVPTTYPEWNINQAIAIFRSRVFPLTFSRHICRQSRRSGCSQGARKPPQASST